MASPPPIDLRLWLTREYLDGEATEPTSDEEIRRAIGVMLASERAEHAESMRFWRDENDRLRAGLRHIAETCIQEPDVAQFALRLIDGSARQAAACPA